MFHVKHRQIGLMALVVVSILAIGCTGRIQQPEGWAAPTAIGDNLLVQSGTGQFSLIQPSSGDVLWTYPTEDFEKHPFYASPVVDGSTLYIADYLGRVTRLELGNGAPQPSWTHDLAAQVVATPILIGSSLLVSTEDGHIAVLAAADGTLERRITTADRRIWGTPASAGSTIYVTDLDHGATVAFDLTSGEQIWEQTGTGASAADLELDRNLLLVPAFDRALHAIDVDTAGSEIWTFEGDGWFMGRPLIQGNTVYAATMQGTVYAIDRATGTEKWSYTAPDKAEFRSALVVVDGAVLAASRDGRLFSIDASTGTLNWSEQAVESGKVNANIYADGSQVYLLTSSYALVTVDLATQIAKPITMAANR